MVWLGYMTGISLSLHLTVFLALVDGSQFYHSQVHPEPASMTYPLLGSLSVSYHKLNQIDFNNASQNCILYTKTSEIP